MTHRAGAAVLLAALTLATLGCGVQSPDLLALTRRGVLPDADVTLVVTDDGHVKCSAANHARARPLADPLLLQARELQREVVADARRNRRFPLRPGSELSYRVRTQDGTVGWSDTSRPLPLRYFKLALLAREVAKGPCGRRR